MATVSLIECAKGWQFEISDRTITTYSPPRYKTSDEAREAAKQWAKEHKVELEDTLPAEEKETT